MRSVRESTIVGEGGNVRECEFKILCYTTKPNAGIAREVGGKMTIFQTGGSNYNSASVYIVIPHCHNQAASTCAIWLLTDPSAPTLCLINASARRHSFPITTDPDVRSLFGVSSLSLLIGILCIAFLSDVLSSGSLIRAQVIPFSKPGGK
jgi:hypothetical protein